jgi:hypothetical protein
MTLEPKKRSAPRHNVINIKVLWFSARQKTTSSWRNWKKLKAFWNLLLFPLSFVSERCFSIKTSSWTSSDSAFLINICAMLSLHFISFICCGIIKCQTNINWMLPLSLAKEWERVLNNCYCPQRQINFCGPFKFIEQIYFVRDLPKFLRYVHIRIMANLIEFFYRKYFIFSRK